MVQRKLLNSVNNLLNHRLALFYSLFHKLIYSHILQKRYFKSHSYQTPIVHSFIMPSILPNDVRVGFSSVFEPMEKMGGDFFDIIEMEKGIYGFLLLTLRNMEYPLLCSLYDIVPILKLGSKIFLAC